VREIAGGFGARGKRHDACLETSSPFQKIAPPKRRDDIMPAKKCNVITFFFFFAEDGRRPS
jgi:hypothetical protein